MSLHVPLIEARVNVERSEIIAAAFASDMPTWMFDELVAALYPEDFCDAPPLASPTREIRNAE